MYFDFEDCRPDISPVGRAMSAREGVLISLVIHAAALLYILFGPELLPASATRTRVVATPQAPRQETHFVFMQPRVDLEALRPPPRADASDKNREARTRLRAPNPTNTQPLSRGNTPERVEPAPAPMARAPEQPPVSLREGGAGGREAARDAPAVMDSPRATMTAPPPVQAPRGGTPGFAPGALGEALRNLQKYLPQESFENPSGGQSPYGSTIQFDSKGVEFGPWLRRFVAQIKRNWFIPYAAMSMKGHTVLTFYVHKDGAISDLSVQQPSLVEAFTNAAFNALASSNPTTPLPPEYPADKAFFTVTFYYNETPPQ